MWLVPATGASDWCQRLYMSETVVGMDMYVRAEPRKQKDVLIAGEIRVTLGQTFGNVLATVHV